MSDGAQGRRRSTAHAAPIAFGPVDEDSSGSSGDEADTPPHVRMPLRKASMAGRFPAALTGLGLSQSGADILMTPLTITKEDAIGSLIYCEP